VDLILDTSVLIAVQRGAIHLGALLQRRPGTGIAAITIGELFFGVERAPTPALGMRRAAFADWVCETVPVLPFGVAEARRYAALRAHLVRGGAMIGAHDLEIAATAIARGYGVLTLDARDFRRVPGLEVVAP
jgi:tRNA(fMet)-specific endonuclease VapC